MNRKIVAMLSFGLVWAGCSRAPEQQPESVLAPSPYVMQAPMAAQPNAPQWQTGYPQPSPAPAPMMGTQGTQGAQGLQGAQNIQGAQGMGNQAPLSGTGYAPPGGAVGQAPAWGTGGAQGSVDIPERVGGMQGMSGTAAPSNAQRVLQGSYGSRAGSYNAGPRSVPPMEMTTVYSCPMHPEAIQLSAGRCPKCGMALVKKIVTLH